MTRRSRTEATERIATQLELVLPDTSHVVRRRAAFLVASKPTAAARRTGNLRAAADAMPAGEPRDLILEELGALEAALGADVRCSRCGRLLTDPDSVTRGIGPDCAAKLAAGGA